MKNKSLYFKKLSVNKVRDIKISDGFELENFCEGINLIYGPNGIGKSTTAQTIQELLWPGNSELERPSVTGTFVENDTQWFIDIDAGYVTISNSNQTANTPVLGPWENKFRYLLALHELIVDKGTDFARIISSESQGGYDLDSAGKKLKISDRPKKPKNVLNKVKDGEKQIELARNAQLKVIKNQRTLPELKGKLKETITATEKILRLEQATQLIKDKSACALLLAEINTLPEGIGKLKGNETAILNRIKQNRSEINNQIFTGKSKIQQTQDTITNLHLTSELVNSNVLTNLSGMLISLEKIEIQINSQNRALITASNGEHTARRNLGEKVSKQQLSFIQIVENKKLTSFARLADKLDAEKVLLDEKQHSLEREENSKVYGLKQDQINSGISCLNNWLETPIQSETTSPILRFTAAFLTVLAVLLAVIYNPIWGLLIVVAVVLFFMGKPQKLAKNSSNTRKIFQLHYSKTKLPMPESWETESVIFQLHTLFELVGIRILEDQRIKDLAKLKKDKSLFSDRLVEFKKTKQLIENQLGFAIDIEPSWLPLLIQNISLWQSSTNALEEAQDQLNVLEQSKISLVKDISEEVRPFHFNIISSSDQASEVLDDLKKRFAEYHLAIQKQKNTENRIIEFKKTLKSLDQENLDLLTGLNLNKSEEFLINDWLNLRPEYLDLKNQLTKQVAIRDHHINQLSEFPKLLTLNSQEIQEQIAEFTLVSEQRDKLSQQITTIGIEVENTLKGFELADALITHEAALNELVEHGNKAAVALVGSTLLNWVKEESVSNSRPQVFNRAKELITRFTLGHLQLIIENNSGEPEFKARVGGSSARPVEELSTGEKIQLLMAVRTAFIEQNEPVQLPLLLDEALGTSDDLRAGLIIDALIKISQTGRQIFYFTAQHDEISKWKSKLQLSGTEYKEFDLGEIRKLEASKYQTFKISPFQFQDPPSHKGLTRMQYGSILNVPNINPLDKNISKLHLWHLIEDNSVLFEFLKLHITNWGQYANLVEFGGKNLVNVKPMLKEKIYAAAKAVKSASESWRIGRGKKVDRFVLQNSSCITDTFINHVSNLADQLSGNAKELINSLENGAVPKWRKSSTKKLFEFFEDSGYITSDSILSPEDIRIRVLASVANEINQGFINTTFINGVISSLPK